MSIFKLLYRVLRVLLVIGAIAGMAYKGIIREDFENYKMHAIPALMYHSINHTPDKWPAELCVAPEVFEEHLKYLKAHDFNVVTTQQAIILLKSGQNVARTVILTFDDGYEDNYSTAFPLLKKYDYRGNFYVVGKDVGMTFNKDGIIQYMSFPQLQEMHRQGMEIGSHSMSHDPLAMIKPNFLPWEIYQPLNLFHEKMGFWIAGIAFPNGSFNDAVIAEIKKHVKYEYAYSGVPGCNTLKIVKDRPFEMRRAGVYDRGRGAKDIEKALLKCYIFGYLEEKGIPAELLDRTLTFLQETFL
ncbi:MAG: polysaccharide deacetylase family protein [Succiniclasticum sp.]|uniref:polysaccharide deacetylase family protein n=1 Tax=Succiniclasticum sp. TaxID=2775030 RepID=UPI002A91BAA1|nr:polysaccharide deacetylase family protein [Succiniclasticum sp.]MDY6292365.1 polysaccharide deacetylase family protein [Succiniclasticum sp.]